MPSEQAQKALAANAHCAQLKVVANGEYAEKASVAVKWRPELRELSSSGMPRMAYVVRPRAARSCVHWGQLKLMESELHFLLEEGLRASGVRDVLSRANRPGAKLPEVTGAGSGKVSGHMGDKPTPQGNSQHPDPAATHDCSNSGVANVARDGSAPRRTTHTVVYAGAAPGTHLALLAELFPCAVFEVYDPAPFHEHCLSWAAAHPERMKVHQGTFFTDDVARSYAGSERKVLFICDIRTADPRLQSAADVEASVLEDQLRQQRWVDVMQPQAALLKFRLPWEAGTSEYLPGRVVIQAFPPATSTETRLHVGRPEEGLAVPVESDGRAAEGAADAAGGAPAKTAGERNSSPAPRGSRNSKEGEEVVRRAIYDHKQYEEALMYHNTVTRACVYDLGEEDVDVQALRAQIPGLDACYDCTALIATCARLLPKAEGSNGESMAASRTQQIGALLELLLWNANTSALDAEKKNGRVSGMRTLEDNPVEHGFKPRQFSVSAAGDQKLEVLRARKRQRK